MKRTWILLAAAAPAAAEGMDPAYGRIMDLYRAGLSGDESVIMSGSDDFNFSAWQDCQYSDMDPLSAVGYALADLDGDGNSELVIADATEEALLEGIVFDVWTVRDGAAVLIGRGWDRNRLYLTPPDEEGRYGYYQEGSSSAFESSYTFGRFEPGGPVTLHVLEFNSEAAEVWRLNGEPVSEEIARAVIDGWSAGTVRIPLTPFAQ